MAATTVAELAQQVKTDDTLRAELQNDPQKTLDAAAREAAYRSDPKFYRMAILGLIGIIVLVIVAATIVLLASDEALPDWQSALATTALGGLVGLFAPSPAGE